jgi:hypothetical protein
MEKYSAADLIKKSAMQLVFLRNRRDRIVTAMQLRGQQFQSKISAEMREKNKDFYAEELRGVYEDNVNQFQIFFCVDLYSNDEFYEIKAILDKEGNETEEYEKWYLDNSILQVAFYKALLIAGKNDTLYTPKFRLKEGYKFQSQSVNVNANYYLLFGKKEYRVHITDTEPFISYYTDKILHLQNYDTARKWDEYHKFKDFHILSDIIQVEPVNVH